MAPPETDMGLADLLSALAGKVSGLARPDRETRAPSATGGERSFAAERGPFDLGDVVTRAGDEAWLAGALAMRDGDEPFGVLFIAPERRSHRAVVVFPSPRDEVLWLEPLVAPFSGEPPSMLDEGGTLYERVLRRPVAIARRGEYAPDIGDRATFAEFRGPGRAALCALTAGREPLAWKGERVPLAELDRLPGGA